MPLFVPSTEFQRRPKRALRFAFRGNELLLTEAGDLPTADDPRLASLAPVRTQFLGTLDGEPCLSVELATETLPPAGLRFQNLRELYLVLPEPLLSLVGRALQTIEWDRAHQFCGACGAPTIPHDRQRARVCSNPSCRREHYPRVSPVVIVAVERGPEILMARSPHFPPGIYGVLAGFVDPGETAEDAARREVFEETGIRIGRLRYFASQPWPFPHSLMFGFQAEYESGDIVCQADEIEDAAFFHVDSLPPTFPGNVTVSQWLLHDFIARKQSKV